jgi:hypothetical protein
MSPELSRCDHVKDFEKSIRILQKHIENHPYTNSTKFSALNLQKELDSCGKLIIPCVSFRPLKQSLEQITSNLFSTVYSFVAVMQVIVPQFFYIEF